MKTLKLIAVLLFFSIVSAQKQSLVLLPTHGKIEILQDGIGKSLGAMCINQGMDSPGKELYKYVQDEGKILFLVNDKPYPGGFTKAVTDGILLLETDGYTKVNIRINENHKEIKKVDFESFEGSIISDKSDAVNNYRKIIKAFPQAATDQFFYWNIDAKMEYLKKSGVYPENSDLINIVTEQEVLRERMDALLDNDDLIRNDWLTGDYIQIDKNNVKIWQSDDYITTVRDLNAADLEKSSAFIKIIIQNKKGSEISINPNAGFLINARKQLGETTVVDIIQKGHFKSDDTGISEQTIKLFDDFTEALKLMKESGFYNVYGSSLMEDLKDFQEFKRIQVTGLPDEITIKELKSQVDLNNELKIVTANPENIYYSDYVDKGAIAFIKNNDGLIEKWSMGNFLSKTTISDADILQIENSHFNKLDSFNSQGTPMKIYYCSIGSLEKESKKVNIYFDSKQYSIECGDNPVSDIVNELKVIATTLPEDATIVFARNPLDLGGERFDKTLTGARRGDAMLSTQYTAKRQWINYTELLREFRISEPSQKVVLSSADYNDIMKLEQTVNVNGPEDIIAYEAAKLFGTDGDQIAAMKAELINRRIRVFEISTNYPDFTEIDKSGILLLSGHKNNAYEAYLRYLADEGLLYKKTIISFSCYENGTSSLNSYLIKRGSAKEVIFFPFTIDTDAAKAVISELIQLLDKPNYNSMKPQELINVACDNAAAKYEDLRNEILLLKQSIKQISFLNENHTNKINNISNG